MDPGSASGLWDVSGEVTQGIVELFCGILGEVGNLGNVTLAHF